MDKTMNISFPVEIGFDRDSYNREYLDTSEPMDEIREFLRQSIEYNLKDFVARWPYITSLTVK